MGGRRNSRSKRGGLGFVVGAIRVPVPFAAILLPDPAGTWLKSPTAALPSVLRPQSLVLSYHLGVYGGIL